MTSFSEFEGRVVTVTGAAGGIGRAVTDLFVSTGAVVIANDIDVDALEDLVADGSESTGSGSVVAVPGDIRHPDTVEHLFSTAEDHGGPHVVVNNVGDFRPATRDFLTSDEDQWQAMYEINLLHVIRCCHRAAPRMIEQGGGAIVNVSTVESYRGIPGHTVYSAFNAGVSAFTKSLAVELGMHGIRVNAIAPDLIDTDQTPAAAMLRGRDPDLVRQWLPLQRFGRNDDCAAVIGFLAGDAARFVTGVTVPVDGGTLTASGWYRRHDGKGWSNMPTEV